MTCWLAVFLILLTSLISYGSSQSVSSPTKEYCGLSVFNSKSLFPTVLDGAQMFEVRKPAWWGSGLGPLPAMQMAVFSHCACMAFLQFCSYKNIDVSMRDSLSCPALNSVTS